MMDCNLVKTCVFVIMSLAACTVSMADGTGTGHIQVKCDPGVQILLDGTFKGIGKTDVGGLIIQDVAAGSHTLKAVKEGFIPQTTRVAVQPGKVLVHIVKPFVPKLTITETGQKTGGVVKRRVGTLVIQSLPVECVVDIPSAGVKQYKKAKDELRAENIPAGIHRASFTALGMTLTRNIELKSGWTVRVFVNFLNKDVIMKKMQPAKLTTGEAKGANKRFSGKQGAVTNTAKDGAVEFRLSTGRARAKITDKNPGLVIECDVLEYLQYMGGPGRLTNIRLYSDHSKGPSTIVLVDKIWPKYCQKNLTLRVRGYGKVPKAGLLPAKYGRFRSAWSTKATKKISIVSGKKTIVDVKLRNKKLTIRTWTE